MSKWIVGETGARIERHEWSEMISRWHEANGSGEWIGEGSRRAEGERIVEWASMAKNRIKQLERIGKSEDIGAERVGSGGVLSRAGLVFGWGWPDTMAVVRLAFLMVNQDLVSVGDLMATWSWPVA